MSAGGWVFAAAAFSVFFCTAVNAYTYRIAYPLWRVIPREGFAALHAEYLRRLDPVITAPHVLMFFSTGALVWRRPASMPRWEAPVVFALATLVILMSAFVAGPVHGRFTRTGAVGEAGMRRLLRVSAVRTVLMLVASGLFCCTLATTR